MKDIKIKKASVNKIPENDVVKELEFKAVTVPKSKFNMLSVILFGLMTSSMICYVFMISSSIFYAVKTSQYEFRSENISVNILTGSLPYESKAINSSERISYIDKDSDTSISLK
jgi:hypothetical protein